MVTLLITKLYFSETFLMSAEWKGLLKCDGLHCRHLGHLRKHVHKSIEEHTVHQNLKTFWWCTMMFYVFIRNICHLRCELIFIGVLDSFIRMLSKVPEGQVLKMK